MLLKALHAIADMFTPPGFFRAGGDELPRTCIPSLTGSSDAFLSLALVEKSNIVIAITPGIPDADRLVDDLRLISARQPIRILEFPPPLENDKSVLGLRIKTIAALRSWSLSPYPCVIVAPFTALTIPIPAGAIHPLHLESAAKLQFQSVCAWLAQAGYSRVPIVEREGDYSVRGGIVDAWSPGEQLPVRAEFFGDDLESLRTFDPAMQTSIARINGADLLPAETSCSATCSFADILPAQTVVLALEHNNYNLDSVMTNRLRTIYTGDPAPNNVATYDFITSPLPGFAELGAEEAHHPELFDAARKRLEHYLDTAEKRGSTIVKADDLSGGFEVGCLIVATKSDRVFTKRHLHGSAINAAVQHGPRLSDFDELEPGEYVVHVDHGVGKYLGSSEIQIDGKRREVFTIEYADGAKLHIPSTHIHLLSRYVGVKGESVRLHHLDGKRWKKDKQDAQKAVTDLASALLETQAKRETVTGFAYNVNCDGCEAFEAAFPYEETADQLAAIVAIKADMAKSKPMDRLICGDAGYGKTEVAMRAAFIAAMNGRQVAVLAPTTVLAEQHFESFTSRFDGTPIRIESVSRFQSRGTHEGTFRRIATGACDIVIGTHAILSSKICFHDLGLIIIDEEQRFGVRQKEFLKALKATADIITMSATPIPRTLYLSMTGARDLSLIRTPPRERVAVDTKIVRDNDATIIAAVEAELSRGGQVFFLHNRVATIATVERRLHQLSPKARIVVAHGQMDAVTLAGKMRDFGRGRYDILLSTTIIESGIDIPRANTIIVNQAHTFGMADLYQLRGRVGRSSQQGHAYFLLPPFGDVDSEARERLTALKRHGGLGSGFNLAVRDLELRGAGNLLGSQQSGHIAAIGFSLYCQLLQRTIAMLKGEKVPDVVDVKLSLDFIELSPSSVDEGSTASLPYSYIEEDVLRLSFMRRLAEASDKRIVSALSAELKDRFGPLPNSARRLLKIAELRIACAKAGVCALNVNGSQAFFYASNHNLTRVCDISKKTPDGKIAELIRKVAGKKD